MARGTRETVGQNSFQMKVRNSKVPQPSHPGRFSIEKWEDAFSASGPVTDSDLRLFEAGKWFAPRFLAIAHKASTINFGSLEPDMLVRLHCGLANRNTKVVRGLGIAPIEDRGLVVAQDLIQARYRPEGFLNAAHPTDIIEEVVDGLKYALDSLSNGANRKLAPPPGGPEEVLARIQVHILLGSVFDLYLDLWNSCVWRDWWVDCSGEVDVVRPDSDGYAVVNEISFYRLKKLNIEYTFHAVGAWKNHLSERDKRKFVNPVRVSGLVGSGKNRRMEFVSNVSDLSSAPLSFVMRAASEELYFSGMLDLKLPKDPRLSLKDLLHAWEALAHLGNVLNERLPSGEEVGSIQRLAEFCPTLSLDELLMVIQRSMGCSAGLAQSLLGFFVLDTTGRDERSKGESSEVWHRPLLKLRNGRFAPVLTALTAPNIHRSIEYWTRAGGLNLQDRGPLFESEARGQLAWAIARSSLSDHSGVVRQNLVVPCLDGPEEIDLAFWVGNTLLIGEAKCMMLPVLPHGEFNYYKTLIEAAGQIKRKCKKIQEQLQDSLSHIPRPGGWMPELTKVVPFVLTSTPLGVGLVVDSIPVVDVRMLRNFFARGGD